LDPSDPSSRSASQKEEFSRFKNEVYQKVLQKVFSSLRHRSHNGDAHLCADGITRVLYPGILIESQDAEEAAYFCGCRAAGANHPCPKCLVLHSDLHNITGKFAELRTPENMKAVIILASKAKTKGAREKILKDHGLHDVEVSRISKELSIFSVEALIMTLPRHSTFFGTSNFPIRTEHTRMIPYIPTTWESGESTFGYFF
jgi:hypothetical protein